MNIISLLYLLCDSYISPASLDDACNRESWKESKRVVSNTGIPFCPWDETNTIWPLPISLVKVRQLKPAGDWLRLQQALDDAAEHPVAK